MEELREAAVGYYNNGSQNLQILAWEFFRSMDTNGDGRVSMAEFVDFLCQQGHHWIQPHVFAQLDRNGDGTLDFWEVITLYYIIKTRNLFCCICRTNLNGLYFTCVTCFDHNATNTFDLCLACYRGHKFYHEHDFFLDSYVLLRSRRGSCAACAIPHANHQPNNSQPIIQYAAQPPQPGQPQPERNNWKRAFHALEIALTAGTYAAVFCSIM